MEHRSGPVDITVVIPAYNRVDLLRVSLQSVLAAGRRALPLAVECLVVDDGSEPPLAPQLAAAETEFRPPHSFRVIRHPNSGSAAARLHGLREARGEFVQFLDSDDLLHPDKLAAHVREMRKTGAELSYCDQAQAHPYDPLATPDGPPLVRQHVLPLVTTPGELFVRVQPAPHTPVFRRVALLAALADPIVPASRVFEPAGDTWLFFNCATQPWRVCKVNGPYAISVTHEGERLSTKWEKLGAAALGVTLVFALRCPETSETRSVRAEVGAAAFQSFRRLPRRFHAEYERLTLELYRTSPSGAPREQLGGRQFIRLARVLGPTWTARLFRRFQCGDYHDCRTVERPELEAVFSGVIRHVVDICGPNRFEARFGSPAGRSRPRNA